MRLLDDTDEIGIGAVGAAYLISIFSFEHMKSCAAIVDSDLETCRVCIEFVDKRLHKLWNFVSSAELAQRVDKLLTGLTVEQCFGKPRIGFRLNCLGGLLCGLLYCGSLQIETVMNFVSMG